MKLKTKLRQVMTILVFSLLLTACANKNHVSEETLPDSTPINQLDNSYES